MNASPYYYCQFPKLAYACADAIINNQNQLPVAYPPITYPTFTYIPNPPQPTQTSYFDNAPDDECHSKSYQYLVGSTYSTDAKAFVKAGVSILSFDKLPEKTIILKPGTFTIAIFIADRLRIHYDDTKGSIVTKVNCG